MPAIRYQHATKPMLYVYTPADGQNTEGIGAMAQYQIHTYNLAQQIGLEFIGRDFTNLQHYQQYGTKEEYCQECTDFFNFPNRIELPDIEVVKCREVGEIGDYLGSEEDKIIEIHNFALMHYADSSFAGWARNLTLAPLANYINFDKSKCYFSEEKVNVAVHIRNFTGTDNDPSPTREYFEPGGDKEKYFLTLMNRIEEYFEGDKEFHIYSQGEDEWFDAFLNQGWDVKLHINEHPLTSLYHMMKAKVRVMSNSSMSYLSSLYGTGVSFARENFPHKTFNTLYTDYQGNLVEDSTPPQGSINFKFDE